MGLCPQAVAAAEGVCVIAEAGAARKRFEQVRIAAAKHDIVGLQGGLQFFDDIIDAAAPFLFATTFQAGQADVIFIGPPMLDRKSTRLNSSHVAISYAVFCLKKKKNR